MNRERSSAERNRPICVTARRSAESAAARNDATDLSLEAGVSPDENIGVLLMFAVSGFIVGFAREREVCRAVRDLD